MHCYTIFLVSTQTVKYPSLFFHVKLVFLLEEKEGLPVCVNIAYRRIGLSGAHHYLAHTAYQAHAVFLTKSVQTLDNKHTALKFGMGGAKLSSSGQVRASTRRQCERGSLVNNQWGSLYLLILFAVCQKTNCIYLFCGHFQHPVYAHFFIKSSWLHYDYD